jgi:hypothetical protein
MSQWPGRGVISPPVCSRAEMIAFQHGSGFARVSAVGTSPVWSLQESGDSPGDSRVVCTPATPVDGIALVGAAPPLHVAVPLHQRLGVAPAALPTGLRRDAPRPFRAPPGCLVAPGPGLVRMAQPAPRAALWAPLFVHLRERLVTPDRGAVVAPAADPRVQRRNQACLCRQPRTAHHRPALSLMTCHRLPARLADGLVAALGRRGGWPNVAAQAVKAGRTLRHWQGMGEAGFARLPGPAPAASVLRPERLTALDHCPRGMYDDPIIRIANHSRTASTGKRARARLCQAVPGHRG